MGSTLVLIKEMVLRIHYLNWRVSNTSFSTRLVWVINATSRDRIFQNHFHLLLLIFFFFEITHEPAIFRKKFSPLRGIITAWGRINHDSILVVISLEGVSPVRIIAKSLAFVRMVLCVRKDDSSRQFINRCFSRVCFLGADELPQGLLVSGGSLHLQPCCSMTN